MYTTEKKTGKLVNQIMLSWVVIFFAVISLPFKNYSSFDSFQSIGNFLDVLIMFGLGLTMMISTNKKLKKVKGYAFDVSETEFIYKSFDENLTFNISSPAKSIRKTLKTIEIETMDNRKIILNLDDYMLDFKELKKIGSLVEKLNKHFEETAVTNDES